MKNLFAGFVIAILLAATSGSALAQWPPYPTAKVPKTASGKPDMNGPAPRTPDGKPDLSGIWDRIPMRAPESGLTASGNDGTAPNQFYNIGITLKGGLPFQPWAAELRAKRLAENYKDNPDARCLPIGNLPFHSVRPPRKMIQTPAEIVILYETQAGVRQIFTDGRPLPKNDPQPWWYGYSVGKWEGDTLVVETIGFRDDVWLDYEGSPMTSSGKIIERFRRPNFGTLTIDVTVDDPKAYTKPWSVQLQQKLLPDTELIEYICQENEKSLSHLVGR